MGHFLPLKYQVTLGAGAPSARQGIVASFPSNAVKLAGGSIRTGTEAVTKQVLETWQEAGCVDVYVCRVSSALGRCNNCN